mmetsp:Transcript_73208/g.211949  ORF Transcript_73208/g.211949 Transcript_73208/m.211949 type:complete len:236 (-) Transcript_73208:1284-1991(-)
MFVADGAANGIERPAADGHIHRQGLVDKVVQTFSSRLPCRHGFERRGHRAQAEGHAPHQHEHGCYHGTPCSATTKRWSILPTSMLVAFEQPTTTSEHADGHRDVTAGGVRSDGETQGEAQAPTDGIGLTQRGFVEAQRLLLPTEGDDGPVGAQRALRDATGLDVQDALQLVHSLRQVNNNRCRHTRHRQSDQQHHAELPILHECQDNSAQEQGYASHDVDHVLAEGFLEVEHILR